MLADETDRDDDEVLGFGRTQFLEGFFGVGLEPFHGADPALVRQGVGIGMAQKLSQFLHDQTRAGLNFLLIRVTSLFDVALGNAVGGEEDVGLVGHIAVADLLSDQLRHGTHIAGVIKPTADAANRQLFEGGVPLTQPLQFPETGAAGADREVGVERQHHHLIHAIGLDVGDGGFREGMPVAHGHVAGGIDSALTQQALQLTGLLLRDAAQR